MQKIDYSDINKFLVSIGLVLIGLAILCPYLYFKESFGIYIEVDQIEKFQKPIQDLISNKQKTIINIQSIVPWVSFCLLFLGTISCIAGLYRWFKRQAKLDEKFDKELRKLDLEIESMTPEEKENRTKQEVQEIEIQEFLEAENLKTNSQKYQKYFQIERDVINNFKYRCSSNYKVLAQQKLANKYEVDLLLKAKSVLIPDKIVEIKYFGTRILWNVIKQSIRQLDKTTTYYQNATGNEVIPILIIVYNSEVNSKERMNGLKSKYLQFAENIPAPDRLLIKYIPENEIDTLNPEEI